MYEPLVSDAPVYRYLNPQPTPLAREVLSECLIIPSHEKLIKKEMNLNANIIMGRLENLNNLKFDIITSRALASLDKLLSYLQKFMKSIQDNH